VSKFDHRHQFLGTTKKLGLFVLETQDPASYHFLIDNIVDLLVAS
jgi:hypothetical protein